MVDERGRQLVALMPSTTIQTRISAFEALADPSSRSSSKHLSPPSSPPLNGHSKSASDILETPLSPITAASLQPVALFTRPRPSPSPSPPNLGRKTSLIDLKDWVVEDGPLPARPTSNGLIDSTKTPTQQVFNTQRQSANMNPKFNGTPLISFESPPKPKPRPKPANLSAAPKQQAPPQLPPRKTSYTSLKSFASSSSSPPSRRTDSLTVEAAHRYPPLSLDLDPSSKNPSNHAPSSSVSSFHSVSLSSDTDPSTPGSVANFIATFPMDSDQGPSRSNRRNGDADTISLTESYEEVSTSSFASPTTERLLTMDWEKAIAQRRSVPPKLPERPNSARNSTKSTPPPSHPVSRTNSGSIPNSPVSRATLSASASTSTIPTTYQPRRSAPPPPSRSSDRSSIQSNTTTHSYSSSSHSHGSRIMIPPSAVGLNTKRLTPVPLGVRKRYEAVFNVNVIQRRKAEKRKSEEKPALLSPGEARGRRAVGWRGLSVDLITGDDMASPQQDDKIDEVVGKEEKLEGSIVKLIWQRSRLDKERLAEIWNECDSTGQGALSIDAFVKGMWRIDEELRRAQAQAIKSATSSSGNYRSKISPVSARPAPKLPQRPRDILR